MGILVACVIVAFILVSAGLLALWVMSTHRTDQRLAQLEAQRSVDSAAFSGQAWNHEYRPVRVEGVLELPEYGSAPTFETRPTEPSTVYDRSTLKP
jgi:hypothetical protein